MAHHKLWLGITLLFLLIIFAIQNFISLDPDFGWHLKMGQLILHTGIPKADPFSYTMPNFPFIDHEWLSNIIIYLLFSSIGKIGLAFIFAFLVVLALVISVPRKLFRFAFVPLLLSTTILIPFVGIRPQIETLFLFALLMKILTDQNIFKIGRFFIPAIFLVWANLHGGFALGLIVLFLFNLVSSWKKSKVNFINLIIFVASILVTFLNPYGIRLWGEIWMQISDGNLRWSIVEWYPIIFRVNLVFLMLLAFSLFLQIKYQKHFTLFEKLIYFLLLLAGLSSQRHIPLWVIVTLPLFTKSLQLTSHEFSKKQLVENRYLKVNKILVISVVIIFILQLIWTFQTEITEENFYPKGAIGYLKTLPQPPNLFAPYDWGGYLIWNNQERRVFIDGRMPSWRRNPANSKQDSNSAFQDYSDALSDKRIFERLIYQFDIGYVLWRNPKKEPDWKTKIIEKFESLYSQTSINKESEQLIKRLEDMGWKRIYQDSVSVIYQRPN